MSLASHRDIYSVGRQDLHRRLLALEVMTTRSVKKPIIAQSQVATVVIRRQTQNPKQSMFTSDELMCYSHVHMSTRLLIGRRWTPPCLRVSGCRVNGGGR